MGEVLRDKGCKSINQPLFILMVTGQLVIPCLSDWFITKMRNQEKSKATMSIYVTITWTDATACLCSLALVVKA